MRGQTAKLDPSQLIDLLSRQRDLYQSLRELSQKQRNIISGDRPEMLLGILRARQDLVTALAKLNDELGPFRRNWDAMYSALPADQRTQASAILHEINGLLRVILRTDQEDGALLSARKQVISNELDGMSGGQMANTAYARQASSSSAGPADLMG